LDAKPHIRFDGDNADKEAFIDKTKKMKEEEKAASEKKKFDSMLCKFWYRTYPKNKALRVAGDRPEGARSRPRP